MSTPSELLERLQGQRLNVTERNDRAQEIVTEFVLVYLKGRVLLSKLTKQPVSTDSKYTAIVDFISKFNMEYSYMRLWTPSVISTTVMEALLENQQLLEFVYRGASLLQARLFTTNESLTELITHVADALSCMSSTESSVMPEAIRAILPRYQEVVELMEENHWVLFLYYLSRIDVAHVFLVEAD